MLYEVPDDGYLRFRCQVGHALSAEIALAEKTETLETALWAAMNALEESAHLTQRMMTQALQRGNTLMVRHYEDQFQEAKNRADLIRSVLANIELSAADDVGDAGRAPTPTNTGYGTLPASS